MIDYNSLVPIFLNGMAWGAGFAIPFFVGITWSVLRVLSHPTIKQLARAAANLSKEGGGVWGQVIGLFREWITSGKNQPPPG